MIRKETSNGWIIFTQIDHAELAAEIMKYWGNSVFEKFRPWEEVLFAIGEHDCGWSEWDSNPRVNPANNYPMNFMEMNTRDQHLIWNKCFREHSLKHQYASALIAMHFEKFNCKAISKNPYDGESVKLKNEIDNFITELMVSTKGIFESEAVDNAEVNLKYLQIGDIISLALCHGWESVQINEVPLNYNDMKSELNLNSENGTNYLVNPYPFSQDNIEFKIRGKRLDQKYFSSDEELRILIDQTEYEIFNYTISRP